MKGTIKRRRDFQSVYENGRRAIGEHLVVFGLLADPTQEREPRDGGPPVLVGIVASRKVGNAVRRSRAKRLLRAALHPLRSRLVPGSLVVLVARRSMIDEGRRSTDIRRELAALLARLELLEDEQG